MKHEYLSRCICETKATSASTASSRVGAVWDIAVLLVEDLEYEMSMVTLSMSTVALASNGLVARVTRQMGPAIFIAP